LLISSSKLAGLKFTLRQIPRRTRIGVLGSSLFGKSTGLNGSSISSNANRVILLDLLVRF